MAALRFEFLVTVEAERTQGKFATRDELSSAIQEALEGADLQQFTGDEGGEYEISWEVQEQDAKRPSRAKVARTVPPGGSPPSSFGKSDRHGPPIVCDQCQRLMRQEEIKPVGTVGNTRWLCPSCFQGTK